MIAHQMVQMFAAALAAQFVAYLGNVALRIAVAKWAARKVALAKSRKGRCICGEKFNVYEMQNHLVVAHPKIAGEDLQRVFDQFKT